MTKNNCFLHVQLNAKSWLDKLKKQKVQFLSGENIITGITVEEQGSCASAGHQVKYFLCLGVAFFDTICCLLPEYNLPIMNVQLQPSHHPNVLL